MPTSNPRYHSTITIKSAIFVFISTVASLAFSFQGHAGQSIKIKVDQAQIMRLSQPAHTIIVGNPVIADVSIQDNKMLVLMGKSSGSTNMIALDDSGREIANVNLIVHSNGSNNLTLFKGSARISMNCAPTCERSLKVGDNGAEFEKIQKQITKKLGAVKTAADFTK